MCRTGGSGGRQILGGGGPSLEDGHSRTDREGADGQKGGRPGVTGRGVGIGNIVGR